MACTSKAEDMKDLHIRLPKEMAEKIAALAKENERSVGAQVTYMLKQAMKEIE